MRDGDFSAFSGQHEGSFPIYTGQAAENFDLRVDGASGHPALEAEMARLYRAAFNIWKERQRKYGTGNIARRGSSGILVRLDDKLARLDRTLSVNKETQSADFADETLTDTCLDVANYILMLQLCEAGKWPGWPHP